MEDKKNGTIALPWTMPIQGQKAETILAMLDNDLFNRRARRKNFGRTFRSTCSCSTQQEICHVDLDKGS